MLGRVEIERLHYLAIFCFVHSVFYYELTFYDLILTASFAPFFSQLGRDRAHDGSVCRA